jgi:nitrite reductase/ring-hydroxylating ferredoxin subunit
MAEFHKLGSTDEVAPGEIKQYLVEDRFVAVCTHQFTHLSEGEFEDSIVTCPLHGAKFDVKTGAAKSLPAVKPVPKHEVKVEDGYVYVALNPKRVKVAGRRR